MTTAVMAFLTKSQENDSDQEEVKTNTQIHQAINAVPNSVAIPKP